MIVIPTRRINLHPFFPLCYSFQALTGVASHESDAYSLGRE